MVGSEEQQTVFQTKDTDTWGGLSQVPPKDRTKSEFDWRFAGTITESLDSLEITAATIAFDRAWKKRIDRGKTRDTIPPFRIVHEFRYLLDENNKAKSCAINVIVEPTKDAITLGVLKGFTQEVHSIFRQERPKTS